MKITGSRCGKPLDFLIGHAQCDRDQIQAVAEVVGNGWLLLTQAL
jgi:hypothetical protein